ncbi:hypothetical protein D3C80_2226250 [compost metagenome]
MIQLLLHSQQLIMKLLVLPDHDFIVFDYLIEKFIYFIFIIAANASGELLVMYVQRR